MLTGFVTFSLASVLIVLFPGPDTLVVLRNLLRGGRRAAALAAAGVLTGLAVWVSAAALGVSALLRASEDGQLILRIAGAVYLTVLGTRSLLSRARPADGDLAAETLSGRRRSLLGDGYRSGLATDLLNPKVGIFFVTFMPGFIPHGAPVGPMSLAFGAIFVLETAIYFAIMVLASDWVVRMMTSPRIRRRVDRLTGFVLVGFGLRLALER